MTKKHNKHIIKVSNDTLEVLRLSDNIYSRIETELEVKSYLQNLKYALNHGAKIELQSKRLVDDLRDKSRNPRNVWRSYNICYVISFCREAISA